MTMAPVGWFQVKDVMFVHPTLGKVKGPILLGTVTVAPADEVKTPGLNTSPRGAETSKPTTVKGVPPILKV
jgi:hypothetical protein